MAAEPGPDVAAVTATTTTVTATHSAETTKSATSEKKPLGEKRAFHRLPDEIIQQILQITDPNSFASLILLNVNWRRVSQQADLYAHHLAQCPSYAASHGGSTIPPSAPDALARLRRLFAREVKRNLFEAYLRPRETVIKLVSNSISSSSCPGGEGMQFAPSPRGHHVLAYNSSRIYVIDVRGPEGIEVKRELKILRRPVSTCIKDDGSVLAVLSTEMQVDVYDLMQSPPKRTTSMILDHSPRTIAMSPCGSVLAAAYEGGIEVSSLNPGALATDRRAVKCDGVDSLAFSFDGTQLLGTTVHSASPNTVILTAPYYDPGGHLAEGDSSSNMSALWTTSILFPNTSRDCSHAVLLQNASLEEACWTFTYDRSFETFRAVRIDDLRNGTTYFTGPIPSQDSQARLLPCTLPAATYHGELVSAGFQGKDIWLYGVPEDLDAVADSASSGTDSGSSANGLGRRNSGPSSRASSSRLHETAGGRVPQWQLLCDKLRNNFVSGTKVAELDGVSNVKWVADFADVSTRERLVVAARGVMPPKPMTSITEEDDIDFIDGGRITLLDFDYSVSDGGKTEITIEVGTKEAEILEEEQRDMETEVAIVRRRTVAQRGGSRTALLRAATTAARTHAIPPLPVVPARSEDADDDPLVPRRIGVMPTITPATPTSDEAETASMIEEQEALDAPYSHASPRSGMTLRRAATAAAANRRLNPQPATGREYRRADGRAEHPHESDADNWVPPPPPYQRDDPGDLPAFMRHPAVAPGEIPMATPTEQTSTAAQQAALPIAEQQTQPAQPQSQDWSQHGQAPQSPPQQRVQSMQPARSPSAAHYGHQRMASDSTTGSGQRGLPYGRRMSSPAATGDFDPNDIYDVSPPDSPKLAATQPQQQPSAERPVTQLSNNGNALPSAGHHVPTSQQQWHSATPSSPSSTQALPVRQTGSWGMHPQQQHARSQQPQQPQSPRQQQPQAQHQQPGAPPALDLHIPSPTLMTNINWGQSSPTANTPAGIVVGRLPSSQTWPTPPRGPAQPQTGAGTGYPHTAPPTGATSNDMLAAALPPPPRPEQLASLNSHEQGSPRRFSAGFQVPRVPVGSRSGIGTPNSFQQPTQPPSAQLGMSPPAGDPYMSISPPAATHPRPMPASPPIEEDRPLIVSTPAGVSGAFDPPNRQTSGRRTQTPLLAPIPRHPRTSVGGVPLRPTVERLETIYSVASQGAEGDAHGHRPPQQPQQRTGGILPQWLSSAPASSSTAPPRQSATLRRNQSRAERSAAKNIADARKRGWNGGGGSSTGGSSSGGGRSRKKKGKKKQDYEVTSTAGWTDVSAAEEKGKKCVVM